MNVDECFKQGLLKKSRFDVNDSNNSINLAKSYLEKAEKTLEIDLYEVVIMLAYTSMFHAARALLFKDGIKEKSHICIIAYLSEKTKLKPQFINILDSYRKLRHTALYSLDYYATEDAAKESIKSAEEFIYAVEELL